MRLTDYNSVYFLGIGGIGMSALARWFNRNGFQVAGYDRASTHLTGELIDEGIAVHFEDDPSLIPSDFLEDRDHLLVIYTPAIPAEHLEMNYIRDLKIPMFKRSQVLGKITENIFTVAVAGTHGKTTTSAMIAHILKSAKKDVAAFLGGIASNYNSNIIANNGSLENALAVVEADEFDRSFLTLVPDLAVVTSVDADHMDIYGDIETLRESFRMFLSKVRDNGRVFVREGLDKEIIPENIKASVHTYGLNRGQFFSSNITIDNGFFVFDYTDHEFLIKGLKLGVPGFHNVENATAAIAVALSLGVKPAEIRDGLLSFRGVKRRFEYLLRTDKVVFVDDYAHHPEEISAFLKSLRALYPNKKITAIFQPHLYSRTRDFAEGFGDSLSQADDVILLEIYPAREKPIPGVNASMILNRIRHTDKVLSTREGLIDMLEGKTLEVVATIGAGDIDQLVEPLKNYLKERYEVE
ncbi:MAG: UDP-N-acetylmuramate--L-alanine ligase [Cyclobacteriaceae bacterium]